MECETAPASLQDTKAYCVPAPAACGVCATMVCWLPGTNWNVCGAAKKVEPPSPETCRPVGDAVASVMPITWLTGIESEPALLPVLLSVQVHWTATLLANGDPVLEATFTLRTNANVPPLSTIALVEV